MKHILYIISVFCLFNATLFGQNQVADTTDLKLISNINKGKVVTVTSTAYQGDYTAINVEQTPNASTIFASSVRNGWYWVKVQDSLKLSVSDTASMLLSYIQRGDTAAAFAPFIERSDTAAMLSYYRKNSDQEFNTIFVDSIKPNNTSRTTYKGIFEVVTTSDATTLSTTNTGRLGLGHDSPDWLFHPKASSQVTAMFESTSSVDQRIRFKDATTTQNMSIGADGNILELRTGNDVDRIQINESGEVKILSSNLVDNSGNAYLTEADTASMLSYYYDKTEIDSALISQGYRELNQNDTLKTADFGKILYNDDTSNDTLYILTGITADVISQYVGIETYNSASIVIITDGTQIRDIENTLIDTITVKAAAIRMTAPDKFRLLSSSEVYITASDTASMLDSYLTNSTGYIQDSLYTHTQVDSIISAQTGWAHYIDTAYATAADSFYVAQGSTVTLPIKANMADGLVTSYLPNGVDSLFSQHDSTILGIAAAATYTVRVTFKAKNSSNTGYATIAFDIGTGGTPNITTAESLVFPKGAGIETQESKTVLLYSLDTFIANGCKIKITADTGNLEIYDIRLLIRLDSRP